MNKYVIGFLLLTCVVLFIMYSYEKDNHNNAVFETSQLPTGIKAQIQSTQGKLKIKNSVSSSSNTATTLNTVNTYPESTITISISDDNKITIEQNTFGLCFKPALSIVLIKNVNIGLSTRFLFYKSFGTIAGLQYNVIPKDVCAIIGIDYRLSSIYLKNTSVGICYTSDSKIGVLLNLYF